MSEGKVTLYIESAQARYLRKIAASLVSGERFGGDALRDTAQRISLILDYSAHFSGGDTLAEQDLRAAAKRLYTERTLKDDDRKHLALLITRALDRAQIVDES